MVYNYIYLLQPASSIAKNDPVYKIGRTNRINFTRFKEYPRGSIIIIQRKCHNCHVMENILLERFNKLYIHRSDYGREYFQGDDNAMIDTINDECKKYNNSCEVSNDEEELETEEPTAAVYCEPINNEQPASLKNSKVHNESKFHCETCHFNSNNKHNFDVHLNTKKHKNTIDVNTGNKNKYECKCGKVYSSRQSLSRHRKSCSGKRQLLSNPSESSAVHATADASLVIGIIQQNQEFKTLLFEQSKQVMEQVRELQAVHSKHLMERFVELKTKHSEMITEFKKETSELTNKLIEKEPCSTVNNTNNNQKFNLNFFLNETCKDALNMEDFLAGLQFTFEDLMKFGDYGFVDGMSQFLIKELAKLDVTKRPIHCTDVRRSVIHLKDTNVWKKKTGHVMLTAAIKMVENKSIEALRKWCDENSDTYANSSQNNSLHDKIYMQTLLGDDDTRNKVIKLLNKAMYLDRSNV